MELYFGKQELFKHTVHTDGQQRGGTRCRDGREESLRYFSEL